MSNTLSSGFVILFILFDCYNCHVLGESCSIPNQEANGTCVVLKECPQYMSLITNRNLTIDNLNFIKEITCKLSHVQQDDEPVVCCPLNADYKDPTLVIDIQNQTQRTQLQPVSSDSPYSKKKQALPDSFILSGGMNIQPAVTEVKEDRFPSVNECGQATQFTERIYSGTVANLSEFPWVALLIYNTSEEYKFRCGGTLITKRYVLTAAHCVSGDSFQRTGLKSVRLGEYDLQYNPDCIFDKNGDVLGCANPADDVDYEKIIIHKNYDQTSQNKFHDIALIRLARDVEFTYYVKPICLARPNNSLRTGLSGTNRLMVIGWGETNIFEGYLRNKTTSPILLKVVVPYISNDKCQQLLSPHSLEIGTGQVCAGGADTRDACIGDSGGPLMHYDRRRIAWTLSGIVSTGPKGCGTPGVPGIYTRVDQYIDWIDQNIY